MLSHARRQLRMIRSLAAAKERARAALLPEPASQVLACANCGVYSFTHTALYRQTGTQPAGMCAKYRMPYANVRWYEDRGWMVADRYFLGTTDHPIEFEGPDGEPFTPSFVGAAPA